MQMNWIASNLDAFLIRNSKLSFKVPYFWASSDHIVVLKVREKSVGTSELHYNTIKRYHFLDMLKNVFRPTLIRV